MSPPLLRVRSLQKSFGRASSSPLIEGVDLDLSPGETIAIIGKSGEGKTTLLHLLGLLDRPDLGEREVLGERVTRWNEASLRRRAFGFVFQAFHLLEEWTPLENLLISAKIRRERVAQGAPLYRRAEELLELVGLVERRHSMTKLLSGGEKQRIALARALLSSPPLILADEPTGNLDPENASFIQERLLDLPREGKSLIIVTHDEAFARRAARTFRLQKGRLQLLPV